MTIRSTIWELEPHTAAKHVILEKYLGAWFPIMGTTNGRILYVDGFSGPGKYKNGELGSPLIALNLAKDHIHFDKLRSQIVFYFIEADEDRCLHLEKLLDDIDIPENFRVQAICDTFVNTLTSIFERLDEQNKNLAPSFLFIDPFGYSQIPFHVIKKIMSYNRCEVLITFMYDYINRFIEQEDRAHLFDQLFGTDEWRKISTSENSEDRKDFVHNLYVSQLKDEANIKYVRSFEMVNKKGHTEYFLIFGTNSIDGLKHMKYAMWKVDDVGDFRFSDRTDQNQTVLFEKTPNYEQLKTILIDKFKGQTVSVEELELFILEQTPFRESHYKRQILKPMETADSPEIEVFNRKRRNTYPPGCEIKFL
ncbi:three-Cys-motif partner protein TcmP [Methanobacterium formicicum]|uniref:three-Cys-motif partner protein TcmP n=1 Tax=Methanobacterium formicicum TaxID=2162 RepID=UPI000694B715|nr:three-Cys-motif partner protein TcmP [Methanobacterium formicicum]